MVDSPFRLSYPSCAALLRDRLREPGPSAIQLLAGPRQVGKTTLLLDLAGRSGARALYAALDGPEAAQPGFWGRLWTRAEDTARNRGSALLLLDEIQHLPDWSAKLKAEWDRLRRRRSPIRVVASGSSSLRLGTGARESLAGRFERLTLSHWSARDLSEVFRMPRREAALNAVRFGGYPGAVRFLRDRERWAAYVRDAIVEPALGKDLLSLAPVRRPALLRQVFGVCADSPAQILSLHKMQGRLGERGALETIAHYLHLLEEAFLVAALEKHSRTALRRRAAPPKVVALNNALLAVSSPRGIPEPGAEPERFGRWVENACLAHAWNRGQQVTYWREDPLEVDGVLEG
ncbi:MAG: ATP-binding protein, partial [Planctomycetota bacterium]